jgi:hypothetical protein
LANDSGTASTSDEIARRLDWHARQGFHHGLLGVPQLAYRHRLDNRGYERYPAFHDASARAGVVAAIVVAIAGR